jgi:aspartate aminotransferase
LVAWGTYFISAFSRKFKMPFFAERLQKVKPSPTLAVAAKAAELKRQGKDILDLGAGEPDFDTPNFIKDAAMNAMNEGKTKYTPVEGILDLKKAIQKKFEKDNNLTYDIKEIIVGCGAKHVLYNAFMATLNKGDEVIIPAPYWVSYPDMVALAEGTPILVACPEETGFKLTPKFLKEALSSSTKWVVLNSPSNPTGAVYSKQELEQLATVLREFPNVHILSDDIYEYLIYDHMKFHTLAEVAPDLKSRILTVNGVSKSYAMTGWRIGYGAGPQELIQAMSKIQSQSTSNPSSISQYATVSALEGNQGFFQNWRQTFEARRDFMVEHLNKIPGMTCLKPNGAFYVYPSCAAFLFKQTPAGKVLNTDTDFVTYLLESAGVAAVPGAAFGLSPYFRISYATHDSILKEACERIKKACAELK